MQTLVENCHPWRLSESIRFQNRISVATLAGTGQARHFGENRTPTKRQAGINPPATHPPLPGKSVLHCRLILFHELVENAIGHLDQLRIHFPV